MRSYFAAALFVMGVGSSAGQAQTAGVSDEAIVAMTEPATHLKKMVTGTIMGTQTGAISAYLLGIPKYCEALRASLNEITPRHQEKWSRNLVQSWRAVVPEEQLAKAASMPAPMGAMSLASFASAAGAKMQESSAEDMKTATVATLASLFSKVSQIDPKTVDGKAREKELSAAIADGSIGCGIVSRR